MTVPAAPLLAVDDLVVSYPLPGGWPWRPARTFQAVRGVSFSLQPGEALGVVGESGCGKSTLARALLGLLPIAGGTVRLAGQDLARLDAPGWRRLRRTVQMVFQDPLASLDPRMTVGAAVEEPLCYLRPDLDAPARRARAAAMLDRVGLPAARVGNRYPHEFSGGQCQRVGIARALVVEPRLLVCDEAVSALDVSVQAQVINLLDDLRRERGLGILFIAHDLSVVRHLCPRTLVMHRGNVVEEGPREQLFSAPRHPYTQALLAAVPGRGLAVGG